MKPKIIKQSGNRFLVKEPSGKERIVERDIKGIKKGDYLQPVGKDKMKFAERYGYLPKSEGIQTSELDQILRRRLGVDYESRKKFFNKHYREENK